MCLCALGPALQSKHHAVKFFNENQEGPTNRIATWIFKNQYIKVPFTVAHHKNFYLYLHQTVYYLKP